MSYYTTFGDVQKELTDNFQKYGTGLQFPEAVDSLYRKGKLMDSCPVNNLRKEAHWSMDHSDFSRLVDSIVISVNPSLTLAERVTEEDMIPLLRDVFIVRHLNHTRVYQHKHNYIEMNYVVDGSCNFHFENETHQLRTGELCVISPGSHHDIEITDDSTVYCIMLRKSTFFSTFFSLLSHDDPLSLFFRTALQDDSTSNYLLFRVSDQEQMRDLVQNAMLECHGRDEYSNTCCISWIYLLFACVLRSAEEVSQFQGDSSGSNFLPVLRYIRSNYQDLTLAELSEHFHYSKPHLCTLIKQNTGVSFTALVKRIRMARAVEYLTDTSMSVGQIADMVGYNSADHFSRVFRASYGVSPQEFRRKNTSDSDLFIPFYSE